MGLFDFLRGKPDEDPILGGRGAEPSGLEVTQVEGSEAWTSSTTTRLDATASQTGGAPLDPAEQFVAGSGQPPLHAAAADPIAQIERLAELHRSGALTDAEFAAAKAKLLGSG